MSVSPPIEDALDGLETALRSHGFEGEIDADIALREAMSTDNSVYRLRPDLIVSPRHAADMVTLSAVMVQPTFQDIPITARGGGTGTNGQALNRGVIVDTRRHMHRLLQLNAREGWADVEPGLVLDDLNAQIRHTGWFFAPETSTSNRCTIGGMVSTDASGKGSRVYGKTSDNLLGLEIARAEGLLWSGTEAPEWAHAMLDGAERAARDGRDAFCRATPNLQRRFTGYDLERACPETGGFEWWRLWPGSEGTLGLIARIRVKLRRMDAEKRLIVAGFDGFPAALSATGPLAAGKPTAVEVMDDRTHQRAKEAGLLHGLPPDLCAPGIAPVFIEINGDDAAEVAARLAEVRRIVDRLPGCRVVHVAHDADAIRELWAIRSAGVGLLGRTQGRARPVAFVEDAVVPPENLTSFVDEFLALLDCEGLNYGVYGHADVGCMHIRPALDIDCEADRKKLQAVSDEVFALTQRYGGIFWGEHGKGVRGAYLRDWIGEEAYEALAQVKAAFDPRGRYNPGKLVAPPEALLSITGTPFRPFNAAEDDSLDKAFRCNGNAQCLSYAANVPMCPSYKASADLRHSPKGRADALRAWRSTGGEEAGPQRAQREADLLAVLDTCLGCKACATSCPVQVDIPQMRTHFLADYYRRNARPMADRLTLLAERYSPVVQQLSNVIGPFWPLARRLGQKLTATVDLPTRLARRLPRESYLHMRDLDQTLPKDTVILVQDWFTALFDEVAQRAALDGLQALGYAPRLLKMRPAGKAAHNLGDVAGFERRAGRLAKLLRMAAATGAPMVALDPAFGMMLRQEYRHAKIDVPMVWMPQEFLLKDVQSGRAFRQVAGKPRMRLLQHCTEATQNPQSGEQWQAVFATLGVELEVPQVGCCGMAGLFGHQQRHQEMSRELHRLSWEAPLAGGLPIASSGFSCRSQSARLSGRTTVHPLGLIAEAFVSDGDQPPYPS